jgi:hypothetical protein
MEFEEAALGASTRDADERTPGTIKGTPAFVIGRLTPDGRLEAVDVMSGALPVEAFSARLDGVPNLKQ